MMENIIRDTRLFLFDMDGTLYLGSRLFDFTVELLDTIKKQGKRYMFMTNNSSKSVADYVSKLAKMGIEATEDDFFTSSQATALYLLEHHKNQKLYVCGTRSLKEELAKCGFEITEDTSDTDCIVMGFDTELTFRKLHDISYLLLTRPDIPYIATNPDYVCPTEFGSVPDCGSVCDMLYNVSRRCPIVIGKPQPEMLLLAMEKYGYSKDDTVMIGDRVYTDIASGYNAGVDTIFVLSGEGTMEDANNSSTPPTYIMENINEVYRNIK